MKILDSDDKVSMSVTVAKLTVKTDIKVTILASLFRQWTHVRLVTDEKVYK